jgi:hypothetical protein
LTVAVAPVAESVWLSPMQPVPPAGCEISKPSGNVTQMEPPVPTTAACPPTSGNCTRMELPTPQVPPEFRRSVGLVHVAAARIDLTLYMTLCTRRVLPAVMG